MKDYAQLLYDTVLKPILLEDNSIHIYRNAMGEDYDSQPDDFIIYSTMVTTPKIFGDGKVLVTRCSCDITVHEKGDGNNENAGYLISKVREQLIKANIPHTENNLGYIESMDSMQTNFDFYLE